jgi:hypothetical protein
MFRPKFLPDIQERADLSAVTRVVEIADDILGDLLRQDCAHFLQFVFGQRGGSIFLVALVPEATVFTLTYMLNRWVFIARSQRWNRSCEAQETGPTR